MTKEKATSTKIAEFDLPLPVERRRLELIASTVAVDYLRTPVHGHSRMIAGLIDALETAYYTEHGHTCIKEVIFEIVDRYLDLHKNGAL